MREVGEVGVTNDRPASCIPALKLGQKLGMESRRAENYELELGGLELPQVDESFQPALNEVG
jgi:hypothetical protein